jgi:hypothetical protein
MIHKKHIAKNGDDPQEHIAKNGDDPQEHIAKFGNKIHMKVKIKKKKKHPSICLVIIYLELMCRNLAFFS